MSGEILGATDLRTITTFSKVNIKFEKHEVDSNSFRLSMRDTYDTAARHIIWPG